MEPDPTPEPARPSALLAGIAATLPLFFLVGGCGLYAVAVVGAGSGGPRAVVESFREMGGLAAFAILATSAGSAVAIAPCLYAAGRGVRLPIAVPLFLATLPWLAGVAFRARGMALVFDAVAYADAASRATLMAAGISEATWSRFFGAVLGSALCASVAGGVALAAIGQRAPQRSAVGALLGAALLGPLVLLALYALVAVGTASATPLVAAVGALFAGAVGGLGIGADEPHGRSAALGAAAPVAGGLAVSFAVTSAVSAALIEIFGALAFAAPDMRGELLARAVGELGPLGLAGTAALPTALVAGAALGAWGLARRVRPSVGRLAGAAAVLAVIALAIGADALVQASTESRIEAVSRAPWEGTDHAPVALPGAAEDPPAFRLGPDGLTRFDGTSVATFAPDALARALAEHVPAEPPPSAEEWGDSELERRPDLAVALDARVPAAGLRAFFDAAAEAGILGVQLQGEAHGGIPPEAREAVADAFPGLAAALAGRGALDVLVGGALPAGVQARDPILRHATLGASVPAQFETREGARVDDRGLGVEVDRYAARAPLYVTIGDGATGASLAELAAAAERSRLVPVIVTAGAALDAGPIDAAEGDAAAAAPGDARVGEAQDERGAGLFDPAIVTRQLRARAGAMRACYERELAHDPALAGRVVVTFTVQPSGAVTGAHASENATGSVALAACVVGVVQRLRFTPGPEGGSVTYAYPFDFSPEP